MSHPLLESFEHKQNLHNESILIVDKAATIGPGLADVLKKDFTVVLATSHLPSSLTVDHTVIHVPLQRKVPVIPARRYSYQFIIYNGERQIREFIPQFLKKAEFDQGICIVGIPLEYSNPEILQTISTFPKALVVLLGDVFSKNGILDIRLLVNKFLYHSLHFKRIEVPNDGTAPTYPLAGDDAIAALISVAFGNPSKSRLFYAFPKYPPTELSLAHMMQKVNPEMVIDFIPQAKKRKVPYIPTGGEYVLSDAYQLQKKIKDLGLLQRKIPFVPQKSSPQSSKPKKRLGARVVIWPSLAFIATFLLLPVLWMIGMAGMGVHMAKAAQKDFENGNMVPAQQHAQQSKLFLTLAEQASELVKIEAAGIGQNERIESLRSAFSMGKEGADAFISLLQVAQTGTHIWNGTSKNPTKEFSMLLNSLKQALGMIQKAQIDNKALDPNTIALFFQNTSAKEYITFLNRIDGLNTLLNLTENSMDVAPKIVGFEGKKTYLLLFQNNMELRPGGGFIGSYALLSVENGRIADFTIQDIYDADGRLKGHIEPPFAIRRYLPSAHWFMRDSNFDIDFLKGASTTVYFLQQELGQSVDGVVAVDTSFVKNLLKATGPVYVSDYQETVTADNMYILTQTHAEKNFFPGSSQKKDFLRSLITVLQHKILDEKKISYLSLAEAVDKSLREKHVLIAFADAGIQSIFTINGVSSTIWNDSKENEETVQDFFGLNEANLGVNKANFFITRTIEQHVFIDTTGALSSQVTVGYKNTGTGWPGGDYKQFVRFVLPSGSILQDVTIDGREQQVKRAVTDPQLYEAKNFRPPKELEVERTEQYGKTIYGFLTIVPPQSTQTITISYSIPQKLSGSAVAKYHLQLFKQPGTDDNPYKLTVNYPRDYKITKSSEEMKNEGESASWSTNLVKDTTFDITFAKQ